MSPQHAKELLDHAAASVTPAETDPAARLVSLGRRSVRRRRAWGAAGAVAVAAAVAAVVALPQLMASHEEPATAADPAVSLGGVSVTVPEGWRTITVANFNPCTAEPHTLYLATGWGDDRSRELRAETRGRPPSVCVTTDQAWMAVVRNGVPQYLSPNLMVVKDGKLVQMEQPYTTTTDSMWAYRDFTEEDRATTVFVNGDQKEREELLEHVTWPPDPAAPASGGLRLPDHITSATSEAPNMVFAADAKTLTQIRTALAELRDPVPAGEECTLQRPGSLGISLGDIIVVLGDAKCPQAVSTGGGRVRIPPGLARDLLDLIVASDRAAAKQAHKD